MRDFTPPRWLRPLVLVAGWIPFAIGVGGLISDLFFNTRYFGSDPIKDVEHFMGKWALGFLCMTLGVTPARRIFGWNWLQPYRRILGLFAFAYVLGHFAVYLVFDIELDWSNMIEDIVDRWYITIGFTALVLMIPLALTSTRGAVKRLGKKWVSLHRLIYVIVLLGLVHFWMSVKKDITTPLTFATIIGALLAWRVWMAAMKRRAARTAAQRLPDEPVGRSRARDQRQADGVAPSA